MRRNPPPRQSYLCNNARLETREHHRPTNKHWILPKQNEGHKTLSTHQYSKLPHHISIIIKPPKPHIRFHRQIPQGTRDEYPSKPQLAVGKNPPPPNNTTSNNQKQHSSPPLQQKNPAPQHYSVAGRDYDGGYLLSHILNAIPSALTSLTSLFGMGRGGTSSLLPPKIYIKYSGY